MAGKSAGIAGLAQMVATYKRGHTGFYGDDNPSLFAMSKHMTDKGLTGVIQGVDFGALKTAFDSGVRATALTAITTWEATMKTAKTTSQATHRTLFAD
jgi:hypothetical protein